MFLIGGMTAMSGFLGKQHSVALQDKRMVTISIIEEAVVHVKALSITGPVMQLKAEEIAKSFWIGISKWCVAGVNNSQVCVIVYWEYFFLS